MSTLIQGRNLNLARVFELVVNVTGQLEGTIDDWPAKIQDGIMAALERKSKQVKLPLALVMSRCDYDLDDGWYIHCWASEVVIKADEVADYTSKEFLLGLKAQGHA